MHKQKANIKKDVSLESFLQISLILTDFGKDKRRDVSLVSKTTIHRLPNFFEHRDEYFLLNTHLIFSCVFNHFLIDNIIHDLESLHSLLLSDSNKLLLQWYRTETVVKEEETLSGVNSQESGDIIKVGQRGAQSNQSHVLLCRLYVSNCSAMRTGCHHYCTKFVTMKTYFTIIIINFTSEIKLKILV